MRLGTKLAAVAVAGSTVGLFGMNLVGGVAAHACPASKWQPGATGGNPSQQVAAAPVGGVIVYSSPGAPGSSSSGWIGVTSSSGYIEANGSEGPPPSGYVVADGSSPAGSGGIEVSSNPANEGPC